ncbi:MAG: hypothetical protein PQJ61_01220 [Spirochaetales bacterium]|uniref:VWA containing CoxE family protein n=1 Tax=Candidatus Thalassospirochaeta sargassi TaxID=3119039 RepID=A0AAJ1MMD1_9SPIO|nr:hypothetical protein [Spirochaetales bacterium]
MFREFFRKLRDSGIPVSLKSFMTLQRALYLGLITNVYELYVTARSILIKSERYFDLYDQLFAAYFEGADAPLFDGINPDEDLAALIAKWLENPADAAREFDIDEMMLKNMSPDELLDYFQNRLLDQKERHDFGTKWIGTSGTSPTGHSGYHPSGMRVGGTSSKMTALKVAGDRRYRNYTTEGPLTEATMMEAMKRLRNMVPHGPRDRVDIDETIRNTMKNAGEIEIIFKQSLKDRLKIVLAIDNGGISMDPYVNIVKKLFDHANSFFKDLSVVYFHNTIYDKVWTDPSRFRHPVRIEQLMKRDPETRLIIVGDASMSPYELLYRNGIIHVEDRADAPGLDYLKQLEKNFPHTAWLNPVPEYLWEYTRSIGIIHNIFPMFEISLNGIEKAVAHLMAR